MPRTDPFPPSPTAAPRIPVRGHVLALAVLAGLLLLTVLLWQAARDRELRTAHAEFRANARDVTDRLRQKLVQYELMTGGGAALFATVRQPTPEQWAAYVQSLDLRKRFPGLVGFGFAPYVPHSRLPELQLAWKEAGHGLLKVRPQGVRPTYVPILMLEPRTFENMGAMGYDMFSEPVRREAMVRAVATARPQLTGPVQLVQDVRREVGFLLYRAVYRDARSAATPAEREASVQGFVYLPLRARAFVADTLGPLRATTRFRISDVTGGGDAELYATGPLHAADGDPPAFRYTGTLVDYGRTWRVEFASGSVDEVSPRIGELENLLALGLLASLLMYAITLALVRTEARAHRLARHMTEDFRRSELRFRVAMAHSATGVALLNSHGMIVEANPALGSIVGRDPAFLAGSMVESLLEPGPGEESPALPPPSPDGAAVRITRRLRREGEAPRQVHLTLAPVQGVVGEDITRLLQVEDVTERLRAEARVHALNRTLEARVDLRTRELQAANQELEAFAYSVSHDLRAPLRAIDGFSRMLEERHGAVLDDAGRGYLQRVRQSASRMNGLIDALLSMTRLSRAEMRPESLDVSQLAREVLDDLAAADPAHAPRIELAEGLRARGDAALVRNLLGNLLGNAWKFTRGTQGAWIALDATGDADGMCEFRLRDNGAGFSQAYADKLFRPFQRLHAASQFDGHGIGLASVRRIVERHGGSVRAEGEEGQGATFWFTLPQDRPATPEE